MLTMMFAYLGLAIGVSFLCSVLESVLLSVTPSYIEKTVARRPRAGKTREKKTARTSRNRHDSRPWLNL